MDDMRDAVLVERLGHGLPVGDVAAHERDLRVRSKPDTSVVSAEVEADDLRAIGGELGASPRADAAERTGDEEPLGHAHAST